MKTTLKLLAILITITSIFLLLSCTQKTAVEDTIPSEEEITTVKVEEEPSEQSSQPAIEAPLITIDELLHLTESDANIVIIDVRNEEDYQISHIKGAISVPEFVIKAGEWDPPEGKVLVLY